MTQQLVDAKVDQLTLRDTDAGPEVTAATSAITSLLLRSSSDRS